MDDRLLEYFLHVAETGSINRAAAALRLSQPALSRHIAALEHEMGNKLFTRTRGGVSLTEAGQLLADRARPLLQQISLLKAQVREKASGQIAIGTPPAWQTRITAPFIAAVNQQFPAIAVRIYEGVSHLVRDYMSARLLDLAIVPIEFTPAAGYLTSPLAREPMVLVGAATHRFRADSPVTLADVSGCKLVLPGPANAARHQLEHAMARRRLTVRLAAESDTLALCMELARRGVGCAVVPSSAISADKPDKSICWAPIRGQSVTWGLCENQDRTFSPAVREGRRLLRATLTRSLASAGWFGATSMPG